MEAGSTGVRVAIDGKDAAGKTTLADHLASALVGGPQEVIRAGIASLLCPYFDAPGCQKEVRAPASASVDFQLDGQMRRLGDTRS